MKKWLIALFLISALVFSGCGGSSSNDSTNLDELTDTSGTNTDKYISGISLNDSMNYFNKTIYTEEETEDNIKYMREVYYDTDNDNKVDHSHDLRIELLASNISNSYINGFTTLEALGMSLNDINKFFNISLSSTDIDIGVLNEHAKNGANRTPMTLQFGHP